MTLGRTNRNRWTPGLVGRMAALVWGAAAVSGQQVVRPPEPDITIVGGVAQATMHTESRHPIVEVTLDGKGPFEFVVDSAAGMSLVDSSLVELLNLSTLGDAHVGDATSQPARRTQIVQWNDLRLGEASFRGGAAVATEFRELFADDPSPPVGVLGFSLFKKLLVTFDYPQRTLRIEGGALPEPDGRTVFACTLKRGLPTVRTELGGREVEFIIDTGAATCLALSEEFEGQIALAGEARAVGMARRLNSEYVVREARAAGDLVLGEHVIRNPRVSFVGVQSILGHEILQHFAVTFDSENGRVRFARRESGPVELTPRGRAGFAVRITGGRWLVRYVLPDSPAAAAGLRADEVIRSINGKACGDYPRGALRTLLTTPGEVAVELERDGRAEVVKVAVEPL